MAEGDVLSCPAPAELSLYWFKSRCGNDRDCVPDDRQNTFPVGWCGAMAWVSKEKSRTVEVWEPHNARKMFTITARAATAQRVGRCGNRARYGDNEDRGSRSEGDRFTLTFPGAFDFIKAPGLMDAELRRERARRFRSAVPALPDFLKALPGVLKALDDAQDLLFSGAAILAPIAKRFAPRLIPAVGVLLTLNDLLNVGT